MKVIVQPKKAAAEVKRGSRNNARTRKRTEARDEPLLFVGIDSEGMGDGLDHRPVLLSCGRAYISDADGLDWERVFSFLYDQFRIGGVVYGGFYLSYDFTQWLRSLPAERARMLLTPAGKAKRKRRTLEGEFYFPLYVGDWEVDILGMKRLKIRPKGESRWMYICDSGPFFQCSFLKAIDPDKWTDPIVTPEEFAQIEEGKERRSIAVLDDEMIAYQQLEIDVWERLMAELQAGLRAIGIRLTPRQWFGPGQVAQAWLKGTDAPTGKELRELAPDWYLEAARCTYFGGWFEIMAHGIIPGESHVYDINSAYPYIIAHLPCLRHGRFRHGNGQPENDPGSMCIVRAIASSYAPADFADADYPGTRPVGAMLHRDSHGRIYRPIRTRGYFWLHELRAAERAGCIGNIEYEEWWAYDPCDCPPPLAAVEELYYERQRVGKNTVLGKAIKLLINSIYGKFAQSIGSPIFGNPIYASLITAGCRTMILDAIATHPGGVQNVLMVATDGICFLDSHPSLPISGDLGDWDHSVHENLCLYKPGMYWDDESRARIAAGSAPEFKARGISARDFAPVVARVDEQFRAWPKTNKDGSHGDMTYRSQWKPKGSGWPHVRFRAAFSMISITQAIQEGWDWDKAGTLQEDVELEQSAYHGAKREGLWYDPERDIYRSIPRNTGTMFDVPFTETSYPYEKRFGLEDPWSDESRSVRGITPDGSVIEVIGDALFQSH